MSARNKQNRSNLKLLHVAGSKSFARVGHDMAQKLGYYPGRDQFFVEVHTSNKTGVLTPLAVPLVNKLQTEAALHPELEENSIEEGDLYAHVFGEKEPRGRVCMLGLGPTPQSVGAPGTKAKLPTKLAMEMQLRRKTEQEVSTLKEQMQEMQHIVFSQGSHNVETPTPSPPNSISQPVFSRILRDDEEEEEEHEGHNDAVQEDEGLFIQKRIPSSHNVASTHLPPRSHAATASICQASHNQEESLVGRDVILYHLLRSDPVAKSTIISTNQNTIVGGEVLGLQYYEVLVNVVLKREVELARGYDGMHTMGDAHHMSIAWPSNKIKPCSKSPLSSSQSSGTNGRK